MHKFYNYISFAFFSILFLFSIIFFKERIFYYDSAFQFFKIVNFETFNIEASRYSTFLTQIPALLSMKLGFSLKAVSIIFSVSFILIYFFVYLLVKYGFKNDFTSFAIILSLSMGTSLTFFHPVTEIHQAVIYSLLFAGWLFLPQTRPELKIRKLLYTGVSIIFLILAFFSHPTAVFILIFILGFYLVDQRAWRNYGIYLNFVLLILIFVLKLIFTPSDSYEGHLFSQPALFYSLLTKFWTLSSYNFFFGRIAGIYFFTVATGLIVIINYIYLKNWLKLGYFLLSIGFFFLLTVITYHEGNAGIAMERIFLPMNVFISIPFCKDFAYKKLRKKTLLVTFITLLIVACFGFILDGAIRYKKRVDYLGYLINKAEKYNGDKFIIYRDQLSTEFLEAPWALSSETLLLSSIKSKSSKTMYFVDNLSDTANFKTKESNVLLVASFWLYWNADELNKKYFMLRPGPYQIMDTDLKK